MTIAEQQESQPFDNKGVRNSLLGGALLAAPFSIALIMNAINGTPQQAEQMIQQEPQRVQQIMQEATPEQIQQAQQQSQQPKIQEQPQQSASVSAESLAPFIAQWEGLNPYSYTDGDSRSVGHGFYLGNASSRPTLESVGANFDAVFSGQQALTESQINRLLEITSQRAIDDAKAAIPSFSSQPILVQTIMADMAHTLGNKISQFPNMLKALEERDYNKVAEEMVDSKWFGQVGNRGVHHVKQIESLASGQNP